MAFDPNSTNPSERRALAYAKLQRASNDHEAGARRYQEEIGLVKYMAAELLVDREVSSLAMTNSGVDDLQGVAAEIRDEIFEARLSAGYELSNNQMCMGIYGAAQLLEILVDDRQRVLEI